MSKHTQTHMSKEERAEHVAAAEVNGASEAITDAGESGQVYLIRNTRTGKYLSVSNLGGKKALVTMCWDEIGEAWPVPLATARMLSAAHMAVSKDLDVEVVDAYEEARA
jgi:hypothetical protein